jgi:hypothetical protein
MLNGGWDLYWHSRHVLPYQPVNFEYFINSDFATQFIASRQKKSLFGSVAAQSRREMESARRLVTMITELRYTMAILVENPILLKVYRLNDEFKR